MNDTMYDPRSCDECGGQYDLAEHPTNTEVCPGCTDVERVAVRSDAPVMTAGQLRELAKAARTEANTRIGSGDSHAATYLTGVGEGLELAAGDISRDEMRPTLEAAFRLYLASI